MRWKDIKPSDLAALREIRIQYHQAIQAVAAVGRHFLEPLPFDENATLSWSRSNSSLVSKWITTDNGTLRAGFHLERAYVYVEDASSVDEFPIAGKNFGQLMVWMEEHTGKSGLPTASFSGNLPYELPDYPKIGSKGFDIEESEITRAFTSYFAASFEVLDALQWDFEVESEVLVYPHRFDQSLSVRLKDSGDPETSSYIALGMSPGDERFDQPFFYVNSWPHVEESVLKPLTAGRWFSEEWIGGLVTAEELWDVADQKSFLTDFYRQSASQLQAYLLD